jgi:organic hydroperoxide reductase OsmC/OhrA
MADIFRSHLVWSGATKGPTRDPMTFSRDLDVTFDAATLPMSAAPNYRGDPSRANPEELFVASLSACQALTFLFHCAKRRIAVANYADEAEGRLEVIDGKVRMSQVTLRPHITLERGSDETEVRKLVDRAHGSCFIANSVSSTVVIIPSFGLVEAPMCASAVRADLDDVC